MNAINFEDLHELNDSEFMIMMGLLVTEETYQETLQGMTEHFCSSGLIGETDKVIKLSFISGNVAGENGRSDWLMQFSKGTKINPIKRLGFQDIKWVSDFVINSKGDYGND